MDCLVLKYAHTMSLKEWTGLPLGDDHDWNMFLQTTVVAFHDPNIQTTIPPNESQQYSMSEVSYTHQTINNVIRCLIGKPNVLVQGYRKPSGHGYGGLAGNDVESFFPNTLVTLLNGPHWRRFVTIICLNSMEYLLLKTSIFVPIKGNCYYQLTGAPITESSPNVKSEKVKFKPARGMIPWSKIYYGTPILGKSGKIIR